MTGRAVYIDGEYAGGDEPDDGDLDECPDCDGTGVVTVTMRRFWSARDVVAATVEHACSSCDGTGQVEPEHNEDPRIGDDDDGYDPPAGWEP